MTDPMELVRRAQTAIPHVASYTHKGLIEELAACIREMVEWRPIETAPLGETKVIVTDGLGVYGAAWFHHREAAWLDCDGCAPTHWLPTTSRPRSRR